MTSARFATFNVHSGKPRNRPPSLKLYRESIVALGADIIGLQEVDEGMVRSGRVTMTGEGANALGGEGYFARARRRWDWGLYGNALLAKGRIRATEVLRYERHSWRNERRIAAIASVILGDVTWTVGNTHLSLRSDEHVTQLQTLAAELQKRSGPRVLLGDFNMAPDVARAAIEPMGWTILDSGFTYPSWAPDHSIDFICVQGAVAEDVEVRSMAISDHAALLATLRPA